MNSEFVTYDEDGFIVDSRLCKTLPALGEVSTPYRVNPAPAGASQNVIEKWKGFSVESVRLDQDKLRSKQIHVLVNTGSDFNISTVIRSANAFLVGGVVITERKKYDRRGTVGQEKYNHVLYSTSTLAVIEALKTEGYSIFAVDCIPEFEPVSFYDIPLPELSAFVYGEEGPGLSREVIEHCDSMIWIPMIGGVRSLNLGVSASLVMAEYNRRWPLSRIFQD